MTNATIVKDPVCGMDVDVATAPTHSDYQGQTHYFCGTECKEKFDLKPEQYLGRPSDAPKGGCCS